MFDCSDFTFILSSRNDLYACYTEDKELEQIKKIENCIYSSEKTFPNRKFILIDYNPPDDRKSLKDIFSSYNNVRIVKILPALQEALEKENKNGKIGFYEFVAKHIGSILSDTPNLVFINQDLVFPVRGREELIETTRQGKVNIAFRCKVDYNLINLGVPELYNLVNSQIPLQVKQYDVYGNGDFLAISKEKYNNIGGYLLSHQNWAVDNEILYRLGLENMHPVSMRKGVINEIVRTYATISLDHPEDATGALRTRGENYVPISVEICNNLLNYVVE